MSEQHQMVVKETYPTGAQRWFCPTCGRNFIISWPGSSQGYKRIVLDEGDEQATHAGGTDGLLMQSADVLPVVSEQPGETDAREGESSADDLDDPWLAPWKRAMDGK